MKKLLIILLAFSGTLKAQQFYIKGSVVNDSQKAAAAVTVMLYRSADSSLVKISVTDTAGEFKLAGMPGGSYYLLFKGVSFQNQKSGMIQLTADMELPVITMQTKMQELAAVNVTAQKPLIEVMPDKTVFNVQNSLSSTGLSAFEVLRKAPGVMVDNQNNIILEGKSGVSIFINGKKSLLSGDDLTNYLKTLQSSDIEAIEIITQPSSRYDAAGNAGIINIRLVKNKNYGTNGSVIAGYAIGRYSKYNSSFSFNERSAKVNFFTSYSNSFNKNRSYLNLDRFQEGLEYNDRSFDIANENNHNIRTGLDFSLNKNSTLGVLLTGTFRGVDDDGTARTPISNIATGMTQQVLLANGFTNSNNDNLAGNLNYRFADKKGHEVTVDGDYGYYQSSRNNLQPNYFYNGDESVLQSQSVFRMITPVNIHLLSVKADYSQMLGKAKLAVGIKSSEVKTGNVFNFYNVNGANEVFDNTRSNVFDYTENINAAYFNLSGNWKSFSLQAGLRAEQTISDGELISIQQTQDASVKRNYLDLFPSGGVTYAVNKNDNLTLSYSRRIDRPDYRSLNPFEYNTDELSFSKGNPFLKPQYTDAIKLSNTYNYTFTTSITYSYISGFLAQITDTVGTNGNFISPQNIANQQVINLGVSYALQVKKWWGLFVSANAYRSTYASLNPKFTSINQNTLNFYGSNSFTLPAKYSFEVSGWFSTPSVWSGTYRTQSLGSLDMALQKVWNKFSVRAAVSDLLYTSNWTGTTQYGALFVKGSGGYESRQFRLSLKYNFGKTTVKSANNRQSGAEDEKSRIKN